MTSGKEVMAQVREDMQVAWQYPWAKTPIAALDGCVLLTREEARAIKAHYFAVTDYELPPRLLALLTPEEPS